MTTLERKAIFAVTQGGRRDLLGAINPLWLSEDTRKIWAFIIDAIIKGNASPDAVKNEINGSSEKFKDSIRIEFDSCLEDPHYPEDMANRLLEAHRIRVRNELIAQLSDKTQTTEGHIQAIEDARAKVKIGDTTGAHDMDEAVEAYMKGIEDGKPSEFRKRIIDIRGSNVSQVFDGKIYPVFYVFFARPRFRKTQFLWNVIAALNDIGKNGIHYSFEDNIERSRAKWISMRSFQPYDEIIDEHPRIPLDELRLRTANRSGGKLALIDRRMKIEEWVRDVRSRCEMGIVDYISVDYIQLLRYNKNDEVAALNDFANAITEISNEHLVPIIGLSQVNKRDEQPGEDVQLSLGNIKGTGGVEEAARMAYSLEGYADSPVKRLVCHKNSYHPMRSFELEFDGPSGYLKGSRLL